MLEIMCHEHSAYTILFMISYSIIECWLGHTRFIEANSFLELAFNCLKSILNYLDKK